MTPDLSTCRKVAGIKQTMRALREHRAEKLYIACDADPAVLAPIEALAREENVTIDDRATMAQLGHRRWRGGDRRSEKIRFFRDILPISCKKYISHHFRKGETKNAYF